MYQLFWHPRVYICVWEKELLRCKWHQQSWAHRSITDFKMTSKFYFVTKHIYHSNIRSIHVQEDCNFKSRRLGIWQGSEPVIAKGEREGGGDLFLGTTSRVAPRHFRSSLPLSILANEGLQNLQLSPSVGNLI